MLNKLPPVSHVVHQLLSLGLSREWPPRSRLLLFDAPSSSPSASLAPDAFRFFRRAFAARCSWKRLGTPSRELELEWDSGSGPNATRSGVERPEDSRLGDAGVGLRRSDMLLEVDAALRGAFGVPGTSCPFSSVCRGGGVRRFRDECFGGVGGRVVVECAPLE